MLKAVSTYLFVKERLHPGLLDGLVRSGAQAIEIFAARQHLDYANRKAHVKEIAEWFRGSGIPLNSVHSPLYADYEWGRTGAPPVNIASTDRAGRIEASDGIAALLARDACATAGTVRRRESESAREARANLREAVYSVKAFTAEN